MNSIQEQLNGNSQTSNQSSTGAQHVAQSVLLVGDPHLTSLRIGRRIDDHRAAVLSKLSQCVELCLEKGHRMVVLGDLFDRPREADMGLLAEAIKIFRRLPEPALVLAGNHDKAGGTLRDDTTLAVLGLTGVIETIDEPRQIQMRGLTLHAVPHGFAIPREIQRGPGLNIMITHHDLAIAPNFNPHASEIYEVMGCDLVVNGHDHTFKKPVAAGQTVYFNPGNISRVSMAQVNHVPAVFELGQDAAADEILAVAGWSVGRQVLRHEAGGVVFDHTGYNAEANAVAGGADTDGALDAFLTGFSRKSQDRFIAALKSTGDLQAAGGGDAVVQIVRQVMDDLGVKPACRTIIETRILIETT